MPELESDIIVIGGGMAGVAVAAHLSEYAKVQLLEMEAQPGYHSTGRSAALFSESYGNRVIRALTRASRDFLFSPPGDFASAALVKPRSVLMIANEHQREVLARYKAGLDFGDPNEEITVENAVQLCPILRREELASAMLSHDQADIDVHELQQGYLRQFRARGGHIMTDAAVIGLNRTSHDWKVETRRAAYRAQIIVNAAGAWAGKVAALAGAQNLAIAACRRTAMLIDAPAGYNIHDWPMVVDAEEKFYFKPEAGLLLLSPADETPVEPGDVQPDELDIAIAVDRLEAATTMSVRNVRRKWAGLRSFARDRSPLVGYDATQPGFFWLAALGGYGIQTAPALSALAARMVLHMDIRAIAEPFRIDTSLLCPSRQL